MADSRIVRHVSEFGEWESVYRAPDARLAPYVRRMSGWWERTAFTRRREVPFPGAVLIINIENRLGVSPSGSPDTSERYHAFFAGMHSSYVVTESFGGIGGGIQVDFTPIGAYLFSGIPAFELADRTFHFEDLDGLEGALLTQRVEAEPTWEGRFDLVEDAVWRRMAAAPRASEGVAWAWAKMEAARGNVPVRALAERLSWTPRQLIEGFRREVGLPPKQMARILRFDRAVRLIDSGEQHCLADVAARCGYYDQAHFSREFRALAGCSPRQHIERLIPNGGVLDEVPGEGILYKTASA